MIVDKNKNKQITYLHKQCKCGNKTQKVRKYKNHYLYYYLYPRFLLITI